MSDSFNAEEAKKYLLEKEHQENLSKENLRLDLLNKVITMLREEFQGTGVEVYLVGSITRPFAFSAHSDVDIVLKNYHADRFDDWTKLEAKINRQIEIILFEHCRFQEFVMKEGLKVL